MGPCKSGELGNADGVPFQTYQFSCVDNRYGAGDTLFIGALCDTIDSLRERLAALEAKAHEHPVMVTVRHDSPCTYGGDAQAEPVGIGGVNYTQGVLSETVGTCGVLYGLSATDRTSDEG